MKQWLRKRTRKQWIFFVSGSISLFIFIILLSISFSLEKKPYAQRAAQRWTMGKEVAQVSVFLSQNAILTEDAITEFGHNLENALVEAAITNESENPSSRLWVHAYSGSGKITLTNNDKILESDAVGVGGDYFIFHPLKLLEGSFFSGNDLMKDHIIIDEDAAWQLFGSNDVVGQFVEINRIPHMISGVVRRERDSMAINAGVQSSIVYLSYESLEKNGSSKGINCYELLMPNPVKNYAYHYVTEHIGLNKDEIEIIENTGRYGFLEKMKIIRSFPTRSMTSKAIVYPFWENIARGYEDLLSALMILEILFLSYPLGLIMGWLIFLYRRRTWHKKDVVKWLYIQKERLFHYKRKKNKGEKNYEKMV